MDLALQLLADVPTSTILAVVAIVFAPLLSYAAVAKRFGGTVSNSQATDLWSESAAMRKDYLVRITQLETRVGQLEDENIKLRTRLALYEGGDDAPAFLQ